MKTFQTYLFAIFIVASFFFLPEIVAGQEIETITPAENGNSPWVVPAGVVEIIVRVWGGGGGTGGHGATTATGGGNGGTTTFLNGISLSAGGGAGSGGATNNTPTAGGLGGVASGGTVNSDGNDGVVGSIPNNRSEGGAGGSSPNGGATQQGADPNSANTSLPGVIGNLPGGGAGGSARSNNSAGGRRATGGGGGGAYVEITISVSPGDEFTYSVGTGGTAGTGDQAAGGTGADGQIEIEYFTSVILTGGPCWRTLSSPNTGQSYQDFFASFQTNNTDFGGLWTQGSGVTGARALFGDPNVYTMDATGTSWIQITNLSATIPAGTGILISLFDEDEFGNAVSAGFPKVSDFSGTENSAPVSVNLGTPAGTTGSDAGFSLLGNPFFSAVDFDLLTTTGITGNIWIYDRNAGGTDANGNNGGWISWDGSIGDITDGVIAGGQGFVVQNSSPSTSPNVTFEEADKISGGTFYGKESNTPDHIRLEIRGQSVYNSAWIKFTDEGAYSEILPDDVMQLYPFESEYAVLSTVKSGQFMDIGHFPYPEADVQIPLTVETTTADRLTLTLTNLQYNQGRALYLHDTVTGRTVEIEEGMEYAFTPSVSSAKSVEDCYSAPTGFAQPMKGKTTSPRFYISSAINDESSVLPSAYGLQQNYPNPFNPHTQITYQLPQQSNVRLEVFDMNGRQVATLVRQSVNAGTHTVNFDAAGLSSGVYMYRLQAGSNVFIRKLTLIK